MTLCGDLNRHLIGGSVLFIVLAALVGCDSGSAPSTIAALSPGTQSIPPPPLGEPNEIIPQENATVGDEPNATPSSDQSPGSSTPPTEQANLPGNEAVEPSSPTVRDPATGNGNGNGNADDVVADKPVPPAANEPPPPKEPNPFPNRQKVPEFSKDLTWLNSRPLTKADLKGKFVLLDFWTYCCINCIHILPELKKLEEQFPNNLVVIGVHSAKFEAEKETGNIREAILRYEISHPVINDDQHDLWNSFGVNSWPTICLIDPEGMYIGMNSGEFKADLVANVITNHLPYYRRQRLLDENPLNFALEAFKESPTPLRFPGKILADEKGNRLFISDSNHNRIVITTLAGKLQGIIGAGSIGMADGDYQTATFNHPQGCALTGETLYIADTENHALRKVDLATRQVTTISGTGEQGAHVNAFPGWDGNINGNQRRRWVGPAAGMPLNSPWALWVHKTDLLIAMAGTHQIWKMTLDEKEIGPYSGNGREDIVDGPRLAAAPFRGGAAYAQPSGLSSDGTWLYVADSEGSSVRQVPLEGSPTREVKTLIGSAHLPQGRLFAFGDIDGPKSKAKLQHALEVVYLNGKVYVADTYNHKIKVVDAKTGDTKTSAGTGKPGVADQPAQFHEPAGLAHAAGKLYVADTNNHLIRTIDIATGKVETLAIEGLAPTGDPRMAGAPADAVPVPVSTDAPPKKPDFKTALQQRLPAATVKPVDGIVNLRVSLKLPPGWKINPIAPMSYWLDSPREAGVADRTAFGRARLAAATSEFEIPVRISGSGQDELQIALAYYYCQTKDEGVCKIGAVVFHLPLKISDDATATPIALEHQIPE